MALSQISRSGNSAARAYYQKKISEGKTKMQALVCLRRQLINIVWMIMKYNVPYVYPVRSETCNGVYPQNNDNDIMQSSANEVAESMLSN